MDSGALGSSGQTSDDIVVRLRQLRSFGAFRRALRVAESAETVASETIVFVRTELSAQMSIYCAESDTADFMLLATAGDTAATPEKIERESELATRVLAELQIRDDVALAAFALPSSVPTIALGLRDAERLVGIAFLAGELDDEVLGELVFDAETALAARVMTRLRAEELAVLEVQERELVGLLREVQERDEIIQKDLLEARDFQRKMLGQPPRVDGATIEVVYRPLGQVGGDLYAVSVKDGRLRLFIADATGHGVSASLTTMFIKSVYDAVNPAATSPGALLEALNENIAKLYKSAQMLFSAACVDLELATGEVEYATAAHPPLCLVSNGEARFIEGGGAFLGLRARVRFESQFLQVANGDGLYLYTDGFTESNAPGGKQFGENRLLAIVRDAHVGMTLAGKAIDDAVSAFAERPELSDDATFIGVRYGNA